MGAGNRFKLPQLTRCGTFHIFLKQLASLCRTILFLNAAVISFRLLKQDRTIFGTHLLFKIEESIGLMLMANCSYLVLTCGTLLLLFP